MAAGIILTQNEVNSKMGMIGQQINMLIDLMTHMKDRFDVLDNAGMLALPLGTTVEGATEWVSQDVTDIRDVVNGLRAHLIAFATNEPNLNAKLDAMAGLGV